MPALNAPADLLKSNQLAHATVPLAKGPFADLVSGPRSNPIHFVNDLPKVTEVDAKTVVSIFVKETTSNDQSMADKLAGQIVDSEAWAILEAHLADLHKKNPDVLHHLTDKMIAVLNEFERESVTRELSWNEFISRHAESKDVVTAQDSFNAVFSKQLINDALQHVHHDSVTGFTYERRSQPHRGPTKQDYQVLGGIGGGGGYLAVWIFMVFAGILLQFTSIPRHLDRNHDISSKMFWSAMAGGPVGFLLVAMYFGAKKADEGIYALRFKLTAYLGRWRQEHQPQRAAELGNITLQTVNHPFPQQAHVRPSGESHRTAVDHAAQEENRYFAH